MIYRRFYIIFLTSLFLQVIFLYFISTILFKCNCGDIDKVLLETSRKYIEVKTKLMELQSVINDTKSGNNFLMRRDLRKISSIESLLGTKNLRRFGKYSVAYNIDLFQEIVTVILYRDKETSHQCLEYKYKVLSKDFPNLKLLAVNSSKELTIGFQFNSLISKVNTSYFFFLNSKHDFSDHSSDNSAGWLLHALEIVQELDFISGSILDNDKLEIPCYRMKLCNWTLSQRYEYRKSIGDLMICENIASSFMGRTSSVERIRSHKKGFPFDEQLISLSTTEFFMAAKKAGAVIGVRPEVFLQVDNKNKCNATKIPDRRETFLSLLPFAHKYKVFRFRDPDSHDIDLCDRDSPILGEDICDESIAHKIMLDGGHWAKSGTFAYPFIIKNLQYCLFEVVDFLTFKKIHFAIDGGVALGTVKMRGVLPWDAGDIDINVYGYSRYRLFEILSKLAHKHNYTAEKGDVKNQVQFYCAPSKLAQKVGGLVSLFVDDEKDEKPSLIKMKTNGRWVPYQSQVFHDLREQYTINYLEHKLYESEEMIHCRKTDHNACLPDFRTKDRYNSKAGTYRELFCDL